MVVSIRKWRARLRLFAFCATIKILTKQLNISKRKRICCFIPFFEVRPVLILIDLKIRLEALKVTAGVDPGFYTSDLHQLNWG